MARTATKRPPPAPPSANKPYNILPSHDLHAEHPPPPPPEARAAAAASRGAGHRRPGADGLPTADSCYRARPDGLAARSSGSIGTTANQREHRCSCWPTRKCGLSSAGSPHADREKFRQSHSWCSFGRPPNASA
ncbi:hypothetical protein ZWY2020_011418 [Hordeum vulgare]|nr:hypothetical protein ZWY2020_011418 [Hordeum vulgare]